MTTRSLNDIPPIAALLLAAAVTCGFLAIHRLVGGGGLRHSGWFRARGSDPRSGPVRMATLALLLLTTSIVGVTTVAAPVDSAPVDCSRGVNLGFETPLVRDAPMGPAPNWALHDESNVPGWDTSASDNRLEFWESTFLGVPSYAGGQHAEMNATQPSILHQDIATLGGDVIEWTVAHRARTGPTDSADVRFGATGSPVLQAVMTSGTGSWSVYAGTYVVPAGQTTTRMSFVSNDPGSLGNFLDGIELELECEVSLALSNNGTSDADGSGSITAGDSVSYDYVVANGGSATLEGLVVTDVLGLAIACPTTTLTPGQSTTCAATHTLTQAQIDAGSIDNDATVSGTDAAGASVADSDTDSLAIPREPGIALIKSGQLDDTVVVPAGRTDVGDVVRYSFQATNTGNITLDSISVTDPVTGPVTCDVTTLAPAASTTCAATLTLSRDQVDSGAVDNTATVSGNAGGFGDDPSATASASTTLDTVPSLTLVKTGAIDQTVVAPDDRTDAGDTVAYSFLVTNTGNVTLDTITVDDPTTGPVSCPDGDVGPGTSTTCTTSVTIAQSDLDRGAIDNSATAYGNPPTGDPGSTADDVSDDDSTTITFTGTEPRVGLAKTVSDIVEQSNGRTQITLLYTIQNYGNVTLDEVVITDDVTTLFGTISPAEYGTITGTLTGSAEWSGSATSNIAAPGQSLEPGETGTVKARFTVTPGADITIDNFSSATARAPDNTVVSDDSVEGTDPDPDGDGDPTNNDGPTPVTMSRNSAAAGVAASTRGPLPATGTASRSIALLALLSSLAGGLLVGSSRRLMRGDRATHSGG